MKNKCYFSIYCIYKIIKYKGNSSKNYMAMIDNIFCIYKILKYKGNSSKNYVAMIDNIFYYILLIFLFIFCYNATISVKTGKFPDVNKSRLEYLKKGDASLVVNTIEK